MFIDLNVRLFISDSKYSCGCLFVETEQFIAVCAYCVDFFSDLWTATVGYCCWAYPGKINVVTAVTLDKCKSACINDTGCFAFHFDTAAAYPEWYCWLRSHCDPPHVCWPGVTHYKLNRDLLSKCYSHCRLRVLL